MKKCKVFPRGDPIRVSHQPVVADRLKDRAYRVDPEENCPCTGNLVVEERVRLSPAGIAARANTVVCVIERALP